MKSAQAYLEEYLGDPDKAARYLRVLREECHTAKDVGYLMRDLVLDERVAEKQLTHNDVYQVFTDEAKLATEGGTTGKAFREALKSRKAEQAADEAAKAAEEAAKAEEEAAKAEEAEYDYIVYKVKRNTTRITTEYAELDKKNGRIENYMIIEFRATKRLIEKEMIRKNIRITDKSHDLCDPLLAISSSKRRFLPRRRAWAA